jgi:hypothetical protein
MAQWKWDKWGVEIKKRFVFIRVYTWLKFPPFI